jgi:hypothetical protein
MIVHPIFEVVEQSLFPVVDELTRHSAHLRTYSAVLLPGAFVAFREADAAPRRPTAHLVALQRTRHATHRRFGRPGEGD